MNNYNYWLMTNQLRILIGLQFGDQENNQNNQ